MVTGASGNVGTALLRRLHMDGGWQVTGVARRPPDPAEPAYHVDWLACDIGGPNAPQILADALTGADALVHLAWSINPTTSEPPMENTNLMGSVQLLDAVAQARVRHVVCASSCAAYQPAPRWSEVTEDWPCEGIPGSAYSQDKARFERLLDTFAAEHPDVTVARIRPCSIAQRDAAGEFTRWLLGPLVPPSLLGRRWLPLPLWPDLRAQLVHSADVAEAILLILEQRAYGPFNLAGEGVLKVAELAAGLGGIVVSVPRDVVLGLAWPAWRAGLLPIHPGWLRLADQAALVDTMRARSELGWRPSRSAAATLAELVAGLRAGAGTTSPPLAPHDLRGLDDRLRHVHWGVPSHQAQSGTARRTGRRLVLRRLGGQLPHS